MPRCRTVASAGGGDGDREKKNRHPFDNSLTSPYAREYRLAHEARSVLGIGPARSRPSTSRARREGARCEPSSAPVPGASGVWPPPSIDLILMSPVASWFRGSRADFRSWSDFSRTDFFPIHPGSEHSCPDGE